MYLLWQNDIKFLKLLFGLFANNCDKKVKTSIIFFLKKSIKDLYGAFENDDKIVKLLSN